MVPDIIETSRSGYELLNDPILNKGTAFTEAERDMFDLHGLLPPNVGNLNEQVGRRLAALREFSNDLDRYAFLRDLQDTNETLFYALLTRNLQELLPIVYTPTVGLGCQQFSSIYRKPRGLFLSVPHKQRIKQILSHPRYDKVKVIVVTDGERILGLGDQGAGGMGIPIGKLALYTACAGIHPSTTLPIILDVGTDNQELMAEPLYIGWRHARVRGQEYDEFVDEFVSAVAERWPNVLLQWEDFARDNASRMLEHYRDRLCTFNDDIQGTAAMATGALLSAVSASLVSIKDQRIAVLGAGSAGCGIANLLQRAMVDAGVGEQEARTRFFLIDRDGLLIDSMNNIQPFQQDFVQKRDAVKDWKLDKPGTISLLDVMRNAKPTALIGASGQAGAFTEAAIREMAKNVQRPVVFPLSNPTLRSEATPSDVLKWTDGRAIIGTGSPFPPVTFNGRTIPIDQTNNSYIFPGVGLGVIAVQARRVTDTMFLAAAKALAALSPSLVNPQNTLLPPVTDLRAVAFHVAKAVALQASSEGLTALKGEAEIEQAITRHIWAPEYLPYKRIGG